MYGLHGIESQPVAPTRSSHGEPLYFEFEARVAVSNDGVRWLGKLLRLEGPERRFVYVAFGK